MTWTDFHLVLVIARERSVAKACVQLGMTHSTLLRKLDQIESRLKTRVFERMRGQYSLTAAGHEIEQAALAFEPIARAAESRAQGQDLKPTGEVRISAASIVIDHLLPPILMQFASAFPEVLIELDATREHANLRRREADIAIRISDQVPDWLVGRKLGELEFKIFALRRPGVSRRLRPVGELAGERRWIGFERDARDLKFDRWLAHEVPESSVVLRVDGFGRALSLVRAGLGIALLPAFLEGVLPELEPLTGRIEEMQTPLWIITHPELINAARIKVLMRAMGPALANAVQELQSARAA